MGFEMNRLEAFFVSGETYLHKVRNVSTKEDARHVAARPLIGETLFYGTTCKPASSLEC